MVERHVNVERALQAHKRWLELPTYTSARFTGQGKDSAIVESSHISITQLKKRKATQYLTLHHDVSLSPFSFVSDDILHTSYSPDGTLYATFRSFAPASSKDGKKIKTIEVWTKEGTKLEELKVDHGDWRFDDVFGTPTWHASGRAFVYAAQDQPTDDGPLKFAYTPDWGERFDGRATGNDNESLSPPNLTLHRITDKDLFPNRAFGQPVLGPSRDSPRIFATMYTPLSDDRRLGLVYCQNRPASIQELVCDQSRMSHSKDANDQWQAVRLDPISSAGLSARSPRLLVQPDLSFKLFYISNQAAGPHASCCALHVYDSARSSTKVLVPIVSSPKNLATDFPGLFIDQLPRDPFCKQSLVATSIWRSRRVPVSIDIETGTVTSLAPWPETSPNDVILPYLTKNPEELASYTVLGTDGDSSVLALRSTPSSPADLVLHDATRAGTWVVIHVNSSEQLPPPLRPTSIHWTVLPLPKFEPSEIILLSPCPIDPAAESKINLPPLVTIPHGGPHSTFVTDFSIDQAALVLAGYRVAVINYPGSLGFGQDFVHQLPPAVGRLDVDATCAVGHYLNTLSLASRTRGKRLLTGGSHGGFISSHLLGQYPNDFDACVMRNPVVDLPSMAFMTDIPDWIYAETDRPYRFEHPASVLTPKEYEHLHDRSPLKHVEHVKTPVLLCIGLGDRRVPPDQGRTFYHALKSFGKAHVEMLTFPDNGHALDGTVEAQICAFEGTLDFLVGYTEF